MQDTSRSIESNRATSEVSITKLALTAGLLCLFFGCTNLQENPFPTSVKSSWVLGWVLGIMACLLAVLPIRSASSQLQRTYSSVTLAISMVGCWLPMIAFFHANHTYYWPVIGVLALTTTVGSWHSGLRAVPIGAALFLGSWFYGIVLPPSSQYPLTRQGDGIRCVLRSPNEIEFQDLAGRDISTVIDESTIETSATVGFFIRATTTARRIITLANVKARRGDRPFVAMNPAIQKPIWSRSMNLNVSVQRWPSVTACELTIPLNPLATEPISTVAAEYAISASHFSRENPKSGSLLFNFVYSRTPKVATGTASTGWVSPAHFQLTGKEYAIVDNLGHHLQPREMGSPVHPYNGGYFTEVAALVRLDSLDPKAKWIQIQIFAPEDLANNRTIFAFDRVP